jgi:hypothetical protein
MIEPDDIDSVFVPARKPSVTGIELDGEMVLFDEQHETIHLLNHTGAVVWQCIDGAGAAEVIASDLATAFGADEATVSRDVLALLRDFGRKGLLSDVRPDDAILDEHRLDALEAPELTDG